MVMNIPDELPRDEAGVEVFDAPPETAPEMGIEIADIVVGY